MQKYLTTAGAGEYEGWLFSIRIPRDSGLHQVWAMTPEGMIKTFPLSKPHFLSEVNVVQPTSTLVEMILFLQKEGADAVPVWMRLTEAEDPQIVEIQAWGAVLLGENRPDREQLGRWAREGWVKWASTLPSAKYDWVKPYDELSDGMKEADMVMGEYLLQKIATHVQGRDSLG